jgi:hypothetical protein
MTAVRESSMLVSVHTPQAPKVRTPSTKIHIGP